MQIMQDKISVNILLLTLVSICIIFLQQGEINRDGVMYLTQSQYIVEGNWDKAMEIYNWAFFSILIAGLHQLTGLSLQYAAHMINVALFVLASFFFIKNVTLVSLNKTNILFATLILLTSIPLMDDYLSMVLRDQGQWAGFMIGVYGYLRWIKSPQWLWAALWQAGFLFGTLFRPECLLFNILLPLSHQLFIVKTERIKAFIQSVSIPIVGVLLLPILWFILGVDVSAIDFARLNEIILRPSRFLNTMLQPLAIETQNYFLKVLIADYALSFKYFFLSYVLVYKWAAGLGLLHLFLFGYAIQQRLISSPYLKALAIFFIISSIISTINLYTTFVLANRYWVMNFWIVYIVAAIGLGHLWRTIEHYKHPKQSWMKWGLVSIMTIFLLNIVIDKPEQHFEQQAGRWVKEQQLDLNNIYFNQSRVAFYAGVLAHDQVDLDTAVSQIQYPYLMIRYQRFKEFKEIKHYQAIQYFPSREQPKVVVYQRAGNEKQQSIK